MGYERDDRVCDKCSRYSLQDFFEYTSLSGDPPDPTQRWGLWDARVFEDIQEHIDCPMCRLVCRSLVQDTRSRFPEAKDMIYYYRMLFGEYEAKHVGVEYIKSPRLRDDALLWRHHEINRLHVSTDGEHLDNVNREFARIRDSFGPGTPLPDEVSEGDIMIL